MMNTPPNLSYHPTASQAPTAGSPFNPWQLFYGSFTPDPIDARPDLPPAAKQIYGKLCQYAGRNGYAFPSIATLTQATGLSRQGVLNALARLEEKKLIRRQRPTGERGSRRSNVYFFLWDDSLASGLRKYPTPPTTPPSQQSGPGTKQAKDNAIRIDDVKQQPVKTSCLVNKVDLNGISKDKENQKPSSSVPTQGKVRKDDDKMLIRFSRFGLTEKQARHYCGRIELPAITQKLGEIEKRYRRGEVRNLPAYTITTMEAMTMTVPIVQERRERRQRQADVVTTPIVIDPGQEAAGRFLDWQEQRLAEILEERRIDPHHDRDLVREFGRSLTGEHRTRFRELDGDIERSGILTMEFTRFLIGRFLTDEERSIEAWRARCDAVGG